MQIIAHRINTVEELKTVPTRYGVEVDVRAYADDLVLNHEPLVGGESLDNYLQNYEHSFIIFNIKEAGIEQHVIDLAKKYGVKDYFLLDVEFPYLYNASRNLGVRDIAVRFSEAEPKEYALAQQGLVDWVWVDTNTVLPLDKITADEFKSAGFKTCLVCPERWGRPEDISVYKKQLADDGIKLDAVMTSMKYVDAWQSP